MRKFIFVTSATCALVVLLLNSSLALSHTTEKPGSRDFCRVIQNIPVEDISTGAESSVEIRQHRQTKYIPEGSVIPCSRYRYKHMFPGYPWIRAVHTVGHQVLPEVSPVDREFYLKSLNGITAKTKDEGKPVELFLHRSHVKALSTFHCVVHDKRCNDIKTNAHNRDLQVRYWKGQAGFYVNGQHMKMFISDAIWDAKYHEPLFSHTGELFYKVDLVPDNKTAIQRYLHGDKTGVAWAYVDSFGLTGKTFTQRATEFIDSSSSETAARLKCCEVGRSPLQAFIDFNERALKSTRDQKIIKLVGQHRCERWLSPYHLNKTSIRGWNYVANRYINTSYHSLNQHTVLGATPRQLANIDILARTLYGEMRGCEAGSDDHYYYEVANVVLDRLRQCKVQRSAFCNRGHANIAGVVTKKSQFSCWKPSDPNFRNIVCVNPTIPAGKKAWQDAVRVASEAVLYPETFTKETKAMGISDTAYYYYSPRSELHRPEWVPHKEYLGGDSCLKLYADKPRYRRYRHLAKRIVDRVINRLPADIHN